VADDRERSAEEREAARLERERRRAARSGQAPPPASAAPRPTPRTPKPVQRAPKPVPRTPKPVQRAPKPVPRTRKPAQPARKPAQPAPEPVERVPEPATVSSAAPDRSPGRAAGTAPAEVPPATDHPAATPPPLPIEPRGDSDHDDDGAYQTGEHELELPSGTRRVSARDKPSTRPERKPRKPRRQRLPGEARRHSWLGRIASVVALALAGGVIWFLVELFQPFGSSPHGSVTVTIPQKATSSQIGDLLQRQGVISSSFFFEARATLAGERSSMRAGTYHLQLDMSYGAVLTKLTKAPAAAKVTEITIAEGRRRQQIDALLRQQHVRGSYLAATRSTKLLNLRAYGLRHKPPSLEGFLFPDTYQVVQPVRIPTLVADQLKTFKQQFAKVGLGYARSKHLTPYEVLIIGSLIEAETPTAHDRPLVASVIYNRLADGMALGLDATTQYATGNFTRPLTVSQLRSRSPYNTRTHVGLPPTPIDNPGLASLQAAAHPARSGYLFFFAKPCARGSVFATNYAQFLALGRRYSSKHC
jgi:uncharacterized YceG family protein